MVLRNKRFHQYNRFYLLFVGLFSWLIPLIKIQFVQPAGVEQPQLIQLANIVADNNTEFEQIVLQQGFAVNWDFLAMVVYTLVSAFFLTTFIVGIIKVYQLLKTNSCKNIGDVYLILTNAKGTPFSFFKYIFWNEAIDINTLTGKQMMQHELIHVQEKHSADKLFMQLVILFGWFNPFFWLAKKELNMIHEFIADHKAIENGDTASFATMLLTAAYPQQQYLLSNPFFFSPIKRRLAMLTNTKNPKWSYVRRLVVLPLLATLVLLFAFRKKEVDKNIPLNKVYTVVVDAGHGGSDNGVSALDGTTEKELSLLMLKAIKAVNTNDKIKLVFTRETDVLQTPVEKANFVNAQKADLFISLHMNWAPEKGSKVNGVEIFIPRDADRRNIDQCEAFASSIESVINKSYNSRGVHSRERGIWILKATECPAVLIECGFISNKKDLAMLKDEAQRKKMAELILAGIGNYLEAFETNEKSIEQNEASNIKNKNRYPDTLLWIKGNDTTPVQLRFRDKNGKINFVRKGGDTTLEKFKQTDASLKIYEVELKSRSVLTSKWKITNVLIFIDGKKVAIEELYKMTPDEIESFKIIKEKEALKPYGKEGESGVVIITTKKKQTPISMLSPLNNSYVAEGFGKNIHESKISFSNDGILIKSKSDANVKSVAKGTVSYTGNVGGENVIIVKGEEYFYSYSKLNDLKVKRGDAVTKGDILAIAGNEDNESTVMLMVTDKKGKSLNPASVLSSK
jgi:N-acetylmuramoyl-L-alanine amidase/murein DD-endopeptidase MepM/ murein hydrolase activator NlpD